MSGDIDDNFLTCVVCYDLYKDPRTLSCGHIFCRSCLQGFADTQRALQRSLTIPCPLCRQTTSVGNPRAPEGRWAGQMRQTTAMRELVDMAAICHQASDESRKDNQDSLEEFLCDDHGKDIIYYCLDCKAMACVVCEAETHVCCMGLVSLEEGKTHVTEELADIKEKLRQMSRFVQKGIESRITRQEEVKKETEACREEIKAFSQEVINVVKEKETRLLNDLEKLSELQLVKVKLGLRLSERTASISHHQSRLIDEVLHSDSIPKMMKLFRQCERLFFVDEGLVGRDHIATVIHQRDTFLDKNVIEEILGSVSIQCEPERPRHPGIVVDDKVIVRLDEDEEVPYIVDIAMVTFLGTEILIASDNANCSVKSFYSDEGRVRHSYLPFCSPPEGLDKLVSNQVLVAFPGSCQIARLKVTPRLKMISMFISGKSYRSIATLTADTFAAGSCNNIPCVDILDMGGKLLKTLRTDFPLEKPSYLCALSADKLLISDYSVGRVTCVTMEGLVEFRYDHGLQSPSGIVVTQSGSVAVVDRETGSLIRYGQNQKDYKSRAKAHRLAEPFQKAPLAVCVDMYDRIYITVGDSIRVLTDQPQSDTIESIYDDFSWDIYD